MIDYPADVRVEDAPTRSRLWAILGLLTIKLWALIPHFIVLAVLGIAQFIVFVIAQFAVLFTGRYPEGMHSFVTGVIRWSVRVLGFLLSLTDKYPPFRLSAGDYPIDMTVRRPERSSRLFAGLTLLVLFIAIAASSAVSAYANSRYWGSGGSGSTGWINLRYIAALPHLIVLWFFGIAVFFVWIVTQFVILFTGKTNGSMNCFMTKFTRWWGRVQVFIYGLTDKYPPFSGSPGPGEEAVQREAPMPGEEAA